MIKERMRFEDFDKHFPETWSKEMCDYVENDVLKDSRYLFIKTVANTQVAYCTHCQKRHIVHGTKLKHKGQAVCPNCKSKCYVQSSGMGRKYMYDDAVFVWYERSLIHKDAITARVIKVRRNYSGDFTKVETEFHCSHMYLFQYGKKGFYFRRDFGRWSQQVNVHSAFDNYYGGHLLISRYMSMKNIKQATKNTSFKYTCWEEYTIFPNQYYKSDMVDFFDMASQYVMVEQLTKLGLKSYVEQKLYKLSTWTAVYWRAKTVYKALRLNKAELKELLEMNKESFREKRVSLATLRLYQRKKGLGITLKDAVNMSCLQTNTYSQHIYKQMLMYMSEKEVIKYLKTQHKKGYKIEDYVESYAIEKIMIHWSDYQNQLKYLGWGTELWHRFPKNLYEQHRKATEQIQIARDKKTDKAIAQKADKLKKYEYQNDNFLVRPVRSANELIEEGKKLSHCVGGYVNRVAYEDCNIFVVRSVYQPEIPLCTMQVRIERNDVSIVQCYGYDDDDVSKEIAEFVLEFAKLKLSKATKKKVNTLHVEKQLAKFEIAV